MKYLISFVLLVFLFAGCQPETGHEIPKDLKGKKELLKKKRAELRELKMFVEKIQSQIDSLEPREVAKKLVTTKKVEPQLFKRFVEIQGTVQSDDVVNVSSEIPGRIISLNVKEGQTVRKGQVLATIDVEAVNKKIAELETSLELANDVYARQSRLWKQNIGSEIAYLQAKNNKERLEKAIESVRYQLTKSTIYAPLSGVVERLISKNGEMASPGMPLMVILSTRKVKVVADVPESYLQKVKRGQSVTVKFPSLGIEKTGRITRIGGFIDPANRTFKVEVFFKNGNHLLKPNLLALLLLNDYSKENAVVLPVELVQQEVSGKDFVFVKVPKDDGFVAQKRYVQTGKNYQNSIVIEQGIKPGDEVIVAGARNLQEGEWIE